MPDKPATVLETLFAGTAGGGVFWALSVARGGLPAGELAPLPVAQWRWMSLGLSAFLGAAAAFVAVYWLANTDTSKRLQCLAFALVCGAMWDPVFTGARQRLTQGFSDSEAVKAVKAAGQVSSTTPTGASASASAAADVAVQLVRSMTTIQNPELKDEAKQSTKQLLDTLANQAATQPDAPAGVENATAGLERVGLAAANAKATQWAAVAVEHLDEIARTDGPHSIQASAAIKRIRSVVASSNEKR